MPQETFATLYPLEGKKSTNVGTNTPVVFISDNQFNVEQTLLVELLVSGNHIPTNFETEGHIVVNNGNVYIEYTTYFDEDDEDDTEEGFKSFTIS